MHSNSKKKRRESVTAGFRSFNFGNLGHWSWANRTYGIILGKLRLSFVLVGIWPIFIVTIVPFSTGKYQIVDRDQ